MYTVATDTLGTEHSMPVASAPGLIPCHPTVSMLGGNEGRLEREREREGGTTTYDGVFTQVTVEINHPNERS